MKDEIHQGSDGHQPGGDGPLLASTAVEPVRQRCRVSCEALRLGYSQHHKFGH